MRLIKAEIKGFRRLADVSVNLDSRLMAVVGPNEAGKTSLLEALARVNDTQALLPSDVCRSRPVPSTSDYLVVHFVLDDDDVAAVAHLDLEERPVRLDLHRKAGGGPPTMGIQPPPLPRRAPLEMALAILADFDPEADLALLVAPGQAPSAAEIDEREEGIAEIVAVVARIGGDAPMAPDEDLNTVEALAERHGVDLTRPWYPALREVVKYRLADVESEARGILFRRIPEVVLFDEEARSLSGSYALSKASGEGVPTSLSNLAELAGANLDELRDAVARASQGEINTLVGRANRQLRRKFASQWRQSVVTVEFAVDAARLYLLIKEDDDLVTELDERSSGLRMFVALAAFVARRGSGVPPILLIDEAETHLHYDAQADLINVLAGQTQAGQVVYTTHSPGCLPQDLGTGIRAVRRSAAHPEVSEIVNSFWAGSGPGFSPLLFAMGAAAAAFTPSRHAVIAEGATEMLLLPSLVRAATGIASLRYQVAPGLSETPRTRYGDLDLEAAKVVFLVDGDSAGDVLALRLAAEGVAVERILRLADLTLEDLVDEACYKRAVKAEADSANGVETPSLDDLVLPPISRSRAVDAFYGVRELLPPGKVAIANRLVQSGDARPSATGARALTVLNAQILRALGLPD